MPSWRPLYVASEAEMLVGGLNVPFSNGTFSHRRHYCIMRYQCFNANFHECIFRSTANSKNMIARDLHAE